MRADKGWTLQAVIQTNDNGTETVFYHVFSQVAAFENWWHPQDIHWLTDRRAAEMYWKRVCESQDDSYHVERLGLV